ncbi:FxsB family cyclophane-forming radical SAM/SPASM peptide maturase [Sphaerisporangium sp. B11E5]|uniref:FxsB family cyclophane-forming radical SAM/SPASM peptide maturase n=1 Tax=Sphaerisporangium sp. B11E5 TaxID=3153563 RepID=UPI00325ED36C
MSPQRSVRGTSPAKGWRPRPFRQFVVKMHSRCDLKCRYCYVYNSMDQSWKQRPRRISNDVIAHIAARIAEHAHRHRLNSVHLVLHGGEPLLAGVEHIRHLVTSTTDAAGPAVRVGVSLQTNGIKLDDRFLQVFHELGVRVGVSLDGDAAAHDLHRRHPDGRGSHSAVLSALTLLTERYQHLFGGLLCTVDLRNDPLTTFESLVHFDPPAVDFLLPHGNWASPPPGRTADPRATPYADWLIPIFDRWYRSKGTRTEVRLFADIIHLLLGGDSSSEAVGLAPSRMVVIETDGSIEQTDTLKSAYPGAPATGFHVARDPFDALFQHPAIMARQIGEEALAAECRACPVKRACGGGLYTHRYDPRNGFANPSVYCADLLRLISHIRETVARDIATLSEGRR